MGCSYEDLLVWQKSMDLVEEIYSMTKNFPSEELYGLTSQLRGAVVSIPLNIAEGQGKRTGKDFARFLFISRGSAYEVDVILQICLRLGYIGDGECRELKERIVEIGKMLSGLIKSLG